MVAVALAGSDGIAFDGVGWLSVILAGYRHWVQPYGDPSGRVLIRRVNATRQAWSVEGESIWPASTATPRDARGEHVTVEWTVDVVWAAGESAEVSALFDLLRTAAVSADARVEVHIGAPHGGTDIDFVGETHEVPETVGVGKTETTLTFRQVDS